MVIHIRTATWRSFSLASMNSSAPAFVMIGPATITAIAEGFWIATSTPLWPFTTYQLPTMLFKLELPLCPTPTTPQPPQVHPAAQKAAH